MTTYKVIAAVPDSAKELQEPDSNGRSAWDLATHMAGADVWFLDGVLNGKFASPDEKAPAADVKGVADWYKKEFPNRLERVLALPDHKLTEIIDFFGMKMPAVQYMLFALVHGRGNSRSSTICSSWRRARSIGRSRPECGRLSWCRSRWAGN